MLALAQMLCSLVGSSAYLLADSQYLFGCLQPCDHFLVHVDDVIKGLCPTCLRASWWPRIYLPSPGSELTRAFPVVGLEVYIVSICFSCDSQRVSAVLLFSAFTVGHKAYQCGTYHAFLLLFCLLSAPRPSENVSPTRAEIFVCFFPNEHSLLTLGREGWWMLKKHFLNNE